MIGVVVAGAALYATTRNDNIGKAVRATGGGAASAFEKAADSAEKHHIGEKLAAAGEATIKKAKAIDSQYHITDNLKHATDVAAVEAKKLNEKYDITGNAARAFASGTRTVFNYIDSASSRSGESASPSRNNSLAGV